MSTLTNRHIIAIAIVLIIVFLLMKGVAEGFEDATISSALTTTFNPLATTIVSPNQLTNINENLPAATNLTGIVSHSASDTSIPIIPSFLAVSTESDLINNAKTCEALRFNDINSCSDLGTSVPVSCGFCLKNGKTHDGQIGRSGLYISPSERTAEDELAIAEGRPPKYHPTAVGQTSCEPGYFVVKRPACEDVAKRVGCEISGKLDNTCGQCFNSTGEFVYVGSAPIRFNARLRLITDGQIEVHINNTKINSRGDFPEETLIDLPNISEGMMLTINITNSTQKRLVGQLETTTGDRKIALDKIVAPTTAAIQRFGTLSSAKYPSMIQTAFWIWPNDSTIVTATFQGSIPVTLASPTYTEDIKRCPTGPLIMTSAGQKILDADPCSNGTLTQGCTKFIWTSSGCTPDGKMSTIAAKHKTPGTFSAEVANIASITTTGKHTNGTIASRGEIVDATAQCTGHILSPCDGPYKTTGPHDITCLKYIYSDPSTYSSGSTPCSASGTIAPTLANAQKYASWGSISNIRSILRNIQQTAAGMTAGVTPVMQSAAMKECYGVNIIGNEPKVCPVYIPQMIINQRISLMINDNTNRYIRHAGFAVWVMTNDNGQLFKNDGTFTIRAGSIAGTYKLESVNYPGQFISVLTSGAQGRISPSTGTDFKFSTTSTGATLITLASGGKYLAVVQSNQVAASTTAITWLLKKPLLQS